MVQGLHHIGVMTADITGAQTFYESLGMACYYAVTMDNGTKLAFLRAGSCVIELVQPTDTAPLASRSNGHVDHIAFTVKDIDSVVAKLHAMGIETDTPEAGRMTLFAGGSRGIFFKGPNNERLELFEEL